MTGDLAARPHIERYALSPRHRAVALALLDSTPYDARDGRSWLCLANNVLVALDQMKADTSD